MIREIRRSETIRGEPLLLGIVFSLALGGSPAAAIGFWVHWLPVAIYFAKTRQRPPVSALDLALPLSARRLWLAQVLALGLGAAAVLAFGFLFRALLDLIADLQGTGAEIIDAALRLGAGLVIAVVVLRSRQPALARPDRSLADDVFLGVVVVVVPGLALALHGKWVIALMGLALVLGFRTWRSLPAAFALVPLAAQSADAADQAPAGRHLERVWATTAGGGSGWRHRLRLLRYVSGNPSSWFASFGAGLLVAFLVIVRSSDNTFWILAVCGLLFMFPMFISPQLQMARLPFLDPLPIRRGILFAGLILPVAAGFALGYGGLTLLVGVEDAGMVFPLFLLLVGLPWLLLLSIVFRTVEAAKVVAVPFVLLLLLVPLVTPRAAGGFLDVFLRQLGESPVGTLAAWLVTALLLLGAYALARASFERVELYALLPQIRSRHATLRRTH